MAHTAASEDRGPLITRVSVAVYTVAFVFVLLRFCTRGWLVKKFGVDDLLIGIALLLGAGEMVTLILQVRNGRGRHSDELDVEQLNRMLLCKYINMLLYHVTNWAVKMSILALYHRMCSVQKDPPWYLRGVVVWTMAATITAFTLSFFLTEMFACVPISHSWDIRYRQEHCISWVPFYIWHAAINVVINMLPVLFPLPLLRILKIDKKQRYALILIFSIGLIPLIATTMRLCQIVMAMRTTDTSRPYGDTSYSWSWVLVWSQIEVDVGIVAASLPSLSPLLKQVWSGCTTSRPVAASKIPTLPRTSFNPRGGDAQGLQNLPSLSTLRNKSVSSIGKPDDAKRLTFLFDSDDAKRLTFLFDSRNDEEGEEEEEGEVDCEALPEPCEATQIGVATTVNTRRSRATFVDMPLSPRGDQFMLSSPIESPTDGESADPVK